MLKKSQTVGSELLYIGFCYVILFSLLQEIFQGFFPVLKYRLITELFIGFCWEFVKYDKNGKLQLTRGE